MVSGTPKYDQSEQHLPIAQQVVTEGSPAEDSLLSPLVGEESKQKQEPAANNAAVDALAKATDPSKQHARSRAKAKKYTVLAMVFITSTAMQLYVGLKVSSFDFESYKTIKAILMCLSVLWINTEVWCSRRYLPWQDNQGK